MATAYQNWTLAYLKQVIRRELMDPSAKWWSDAELEFYCDQWQNELQQKFELVWGTCTITTASQTIQLSSCSPPMSRLDAIYYIGREGGRGFRISGRLIEDLEVLNREWRSGLPDDSRCVVQYDSTQITLWPPPPSTIKLVFEYPTQLSFNGDTSTVSLPFWTQWSCKSYVCAKAYLRNGPTNDLRRALRYKKQYDREEARIRLLWDNYYPERYRKLKPMGHYERDILFPISPFGAAPAGNVFGPDTYFSTSLVGDVDGLNSTFTFVSPTLPTALKVFRNGLLQTAGVDFLITGTTVTFLFTPQVGDDFVVWVWIQGV